MVIYKYNNGYIIMIKITIMDKYKHVPISSIYIHAGEESNGVTPHSSVSKHPFLCSVEGCISTKSHRRVFLGK